MTKRIFMHASLKFRYYSVKKLYLLFTIYYLLLFKTFIIYYLLLFKTYLLFVTYYYLKHIYYLLLIII